MMQFKNTLSEPLCIRKDQRLAVSDGRHTVVKGEPLVVFKDKSQVAFLFWFIILVTDQGLRKYLPCELVDHGCSSYTTKIWGPLSLSCGKLYYVL